VTPEQIKTSPHDYRFVCDREPVPPVNPLELLRDDTERQIVSFLQCAGPTSPLLIGRTLGIPQRVITRRLTRLRANGVCEVEGKTRAVRYRVRDDFSGN
jgi:hypothetical protein